MGKKHSTFSGRKEIEMSKELLARQRHKSGFSCASSVYSVFSDIVSGDSPIPRSEGGKCGAVLAAEKVLKQMGKDPSAFDEEFIRQFGSLKCGDLRRAKHPCNDLVGAAARLTEEALNDTSN